MSHLAILILGFLAYGNCILIPAHYYREYLGCFYFTDRRLTYAPSVFWDIMTVEFCAHNCNHSSSDYIGIRNATECHCGRPLTLDKLTKVPDDECDLGCVGNSSQVCGAENRISFYRICPPFTFGFGVTCENHCHCGEETTVCSPYNGECRDGDGCEIGYTGWPMCHSACSQGNFGQDCAGQCHCASGASCDRVNGTCDDSKGEICGIGYTYRSWPLCQEECDDQHYGQNCQHECHCAKGVSCNHKTGKCDEESVVRSCAPGWTYWPYCHEVCPSSCNDTCHPITGTCGSSTLSGPVIIICMALLITIAL